MSNSGLPETIFQKIKEAFPSDMEMLSLAEKLENLEGIDRVKVLIKLGDKIKNFSHEISMTLAIEANEISITLQDDWGMGHSLALLAWCNHRCYQVELSLKQAKEAYKIFDHIADDEGKAFVLNTLGLDYWVLGDLDESLSNFHRALDLWQVIDNAQKQASTLNNMGLVYESKSDFATAIANYQRCIVISKKLKDEYGQAVALSNLGNVYEKLGDYVNALDFQQQSLTIRKHLNDIRGESKCLNNLGNVYYQLGEKNTAVEFYNRSLELKKVVNDKMGEAKTINNLGEVYEDLGDLDTAFKYHSESLALSEEIKDKWGVASSNAHLGTVLTKQKKYQRAEKHLTESIRTFKSIGDKRGLGDSMLAMGILYLHQKEANKALKILNDALEIAHALYARVLIFEIHHEIANAYELKKDLRNSYKHFKLYVKAEKEVFNEESDKKYKHLRIIYQTEQSKKETEINRLRSVELANALADAQKQKQIAEQANATKTELLGIAAHDLRNPLQAIMSYSELIRGMPDDPEAVVKMTDIIFESSNRMVALIRDLLQTSAIEQGKVSLRKREVDLSAVASSVIDRLKPSANRKKIGITMDAKTKFKILGDEERITDIVENLLSNAIKYSPAGKDVSIEIARHNGHAILTITDEGLGISTEEIPKLFGKFQKLSARPTGGETSTGLGLSIVKSLVELHDGKVWAESKGENKGTKFIVELPVGSK